MSLTLPQAYRDAGFQRRIAELERAEAIAGRNEVWHALVVEVPWVTDHVFDPQRETHCPHGHVGGEHLIGWPHANHEGRECVKRQCVVCGSSWLEPLEQL